MRLSKFSIVAGSVVGILAGVMAIYLYLSSGVSSSEEARVYQQTTQELTQSRDLAITVLAIKFDVIQVQQFLQDVSATRALDGLDDGYERAAEYAARFDNDLERARSLASEIGDSSLSKILEQVAAAFAPYYATGKAMADTYVAAGPEGGNQFMPQFDAAAEMMSGTLDAMVTEANALDAAVRSRSDQRLDEIQSDQRASAIVQFSIYGTLVIFIGAMTAFFAGYALRRIRAMSKTMAAIAGGDFSTAVYGSSLWEELRDIATSADTFRSNGMKLQQMHAEDEARVEATMQERRAMMESLRQAFGSVVDASIQGDFSTRVPTDFDDAELNSLAESVNTLVSTVEERLAETVEVLSAIAAADLTLRVEGECHGAFARLKDDVNAVADSLARIVGELKVTSRGVKTATAEILAGANDLADRTTKQSATIEQTSAAMEQLSSTVQANAKTAGEANQRATRASDAAEESGEVMRSATDAMDRIAASSSKIANIIGLIDDVAFQTNLLALNASVEAARAGEAGKGFAVVAIEVRRLAQSAADASSDIKTLIQESGAEVASGATLVRSAASQLSAMLDWVRESAASLDAIARASAEQSSAIAEVNVAVRQMDEMTQHNAALVEETNAAIEQTEARAVELDRIVEVFKVSAEHRGSSAIRNYDTVAHLSRVKSVAPSPRDRGRQTFSQGNTALKQAEDWSEF